MAITLEPAQPQFRGALESLLRSYNLPTEDLPADLEGFTLAFDNGFVIGSAGLERVGPYGLLRSVAVNEAYCKMKLGKQLVATALDIARNDLIREVWLITTTADGYFERYGFERIERTEVPAEITSTPQFTTLCASTAVVMRKYV